MPRFHFLHFLPLPGRGGWCMLLPVLLLAAVGVLHLPAGDLSAAPALVSLKRAEREPIRPVPLSVTLDARKVELGKKLFHEPKLSRDHTVSCASCHDLKQGGADGRKFSVGIGGALGAINAPTVFNSGANFKHFWDGRAASLEEQVDGPITDPAEMGTSWEEVVAKLKGEPAYAAAFQAVYRSPIEPAHVRDALAEFERSLITPNARFDRYLRGETAALTETEREGYRKFKLYGCTSCHQGVNVGGNMFQTLGTMADYFQDRGNVTHADNGRFNVTGREEDRYLFKVPTLRNVALTAPYLHDGSAATLEDAVNVMARYQLGQSLPPEDVAEIVAFLRTLTGEYEGRRL